MNRKLVIEAVFLMSLIFASICASCVIPTLSAETSPCTDCDVPSLETIHNVTVYLVDDEVLLRIEPLTLPDGCCGECETCPSVEAENFQSTVLEDEDGRTVVLVTYEVNGTTFETTISKALLWSYSEVGEANRTASFNLIEITANGVSTQLYTLTYSVWSAGYNLTLSTWLDPLDEETYNSSFTILGYVPAEKSVMTIDFVHFNSSVTLSQQYAVLGKVAKGIGKHYEKSQNETLQALAPNYNNMKEEAKYLSKLVEKNLQEYDKEIINSTAVLMDDLCTGVCSVICGLLGTAGCGAICGLLCGVNPVCVPPCLVGCAILWAAGCSAVCATLCGKNINPCAVGCGSFCASITAAICVRFGPCSWVCVLALKVVCASFCEATVALWC